jgi:hypothetical protein
MRGFPELIMEIYSSTPDTDRKLRAEMTRLCTIHIEVLLRGKEFLQALSIPGFAADVMQAVVKVRSAPRVHG